MLDMNDVTTLLHGCESSEDVSAIIGAIIDAVKVGDIVIASSEEETRQIISKLRDIKNSI